MTSLRLFSSFAGEQKTLLPGFKLPRLAAEIPHPLPRLETDLINMLNHCKTNKQRCLVALLGLEGMRLFEALGTKPDDIDLADMTIKVWGKGDKVRVIPVTKRAWTYIAPQLIEARLKNLETLVPYSDRGARHFVTELGYAAGVSRPVASHDLRATFATLAHTHSKNIRAIQAWLGHADLTRTQIYVEVAMQMMREAGEF